MIGGTVSSQRRRFFGRAAVLHQANGMKKANAVEELLWPYGKDFIPTAIERAHREAVFGKVGNCRSDRLSYETIKGAGDIAGKNAVITADFAKGGFHFAG